MPLPVSGFEPLTSDFGGVQHNHGATLRLATIFILPPDVQNETDPPALRRLHIFRLNGQTNNR